MFDVHVPEHRIGGMRDFFLHLLTITCGLLIAVALENAVEAVHRRQERREVEESIRKELTQNRSDATAAASGLVSEIKNIRTLLAYVQARSEGRPADSKGLVLTFSEGNLADAAWNTAESTGTLRLIPQEEVERFADAYKEQHLLQNTSEQALDDYLQIESFVRREEGRAIDLSPATAQSALPYVGHTLAHLQGMYAVGGGLLRAYQQALDTH